MIKQIRAKYTPAINQIEAKLNLLKGNRKAESLEVYALYRGEIKEQEINDYFDAYWDDYDNSIIVKANGGEKNE